MFGNWRKPVTLGLVFFGPLALSGCMGGPTYGTGKTEMEHLADGIGNVLSLSTQQNTGKVDDNPRPNLVENINNDTLPKPQQPIEKSKAKAWLESPEEMRDRLRAEADANQDNPNYRSPLAASLGKEKNLSAAQQRAQFLANKKLQEGAYQGRRFLSDPPTQYRVISDPALLNDLGEPEAVKERRRKAEAEHQKNSNWWKL